VCGVEFKLEKSKRYTALGNTILGKTEYDCFNCPECGCQNIVGTRFPNKKSISVEQLREYVCDHICVHAAEDSDYLEHRCKECRLEELTEI
jgi:hypothetical protein